MSLLVGCPRCPAPVVESADGWACAEHGPTTPLWRPSEASYDLFGEHLAAAGGCATYLPWPQAPGWQVSDFAVVAEPGGRVLATLTCSTGATELDGPVDVVVVTEEPGTGLGARVAGTDGDPGEAVSAGPPLARVRLDGRSVPLWAVSTSRVDGELDRFVVAGEAEGRWLWLVLRPASAVLLLHDEWLLRDVSSIGPTLVEAAFGGPRPPW